uniref:Uncharacterized protein n=2 Tax=Avena sativa TaxID=4498 RepID=A0ACD5V8C4_AVESA
MSLKSGVFSNDLCCRVIIIIRELIFCFHPCRVSVADGAHLTEFATELPHFEGLLLKNTTLFDANQFMQPFGIAHCFNIRQQFPPTGRDFIADGNIEQRANHTRRKRRDFPQTSTLPKFAETHEFGSPNIFMDPSYFTKATELSSTEERTPLKPPKFLVDCSNRRPDHHTVGLPVQYGDFFITSLGEIDKRASYHNCHQIWPVGFTSYWHDRITGSLFECEVSDGGSFGPLFKVRRLPCSVFPLPEASTILSQNGVRKADTTETKESSSFIGDTAIDTYDNIAMLLSDPSETNQDFFSCLTSDTEYKKTSLGGNYAQNSNMMAQIPSSHSENVSQAPDKEANINDQIGDFTFEGTSSSSVWRMISCAMMEACEKMYKQHGHLVFLCTHSSENPSLNKGIGCQNFAGHCAPLTRFCSSSGPSIPRVVEKNDVESTYKLLKEWLYQDRIGLDLEFVQEIVESLPRSRACLNYQFLSNRAEFVSSMTVASGSLTVVHKDGQSNGGMSYGRHGSAVTGLLDNAQPIGSSIRELPPGHPISHKLPPELAGDVFQKAVLSVLTEACRAIVPQKIENPRKGRKTISFSEGILRKCRIALRSAISSDESKLFGNLLGTTLMNSNENEDDGILGFPGMVSRPLDFRTIDIRLAMGAYCGSWETFSEDVQEVIRNLHIAYADRTDVVEMVVALSQSFEINLLKFLCDEMLNTALIREHIDQCADKLNDLQQKFRSLNFELKDLKYKEEIRASYARQSRWSKTEQHFNNCSGVAENQQNDVAIASGHLEEAEQGNTGVNLNHPAEGAPPGQLDEGSVHRRHSNPTLSNDEGYGQLRKAPEQDAHALHPLRPPQLPPPEEHLLVLRLPRRTHPQVQLECEAITRKTTGTGRMRYMRHVPRRFKSKFKEGTEAAPRKRAAAN